MPTLSAHVPEDWEFKEKFNSVISAKYRGKPAPYIREVVERDLGGRSSGIPESAYSQSQISRWMEDEVALLKAADLALTVLHGTPEQEATKAAKDMALIILQATRRAPLAEIPTAEEKSARKVTVQIVPKESIVYPQRPKKKQA